MAAHDTSFWSKHQILEKNSIILVIGILLMISVGGIVEIAPLFYLKSTIEKVGGVRPYTPLELAGRDIYVREGCYTCHSQMIRALKDEVERYGHYSLAAESMYDHPFQWGSKRNGPDLARVGGKYSDDWQRAHLAAPRSVVPGSIMPNYAFLFDRELRLEHLGEHMTIQSIEGVPYTQEQIANAAVDAAAQLNPDDKNASAFAKRWPTAVVRTVAKPGKITEADAVVAYLQMLGTLVDFKIYDEKANLR
ncbi:MAG: cytochrome-c oxidase, cbb3-type subunit II [Rhizobiales bacterium]|nr:cytochrome-c oxidase, cbb3-type subunit II [Hyphomicrobiales bacterium]